MVNSELGKVRRVQKGQEEKEGRRLPSEPPGKEFQGARAYELGSWQEEPCAKLPATADLPARVPAGGVGLWTARDLWKQRSNKLIGETRRGRAKAQCGRPGFTSGGNHSPVAAASSRVPREHD